jgi:hypothetical protein
VTSSKDFRRNAEECRSLASKTTHPEEKAQWLKLAEEWTRMADATASRPEIFDVK